MSQNYEQDYRVIGSALSDASTETLQALGGEEAEVAALAATGLTLDEVCERTNLAPDQVWALLNEAFDRLQAPRWATGPSGDIRPMDTGELGNPTQGI